MPSPLSNEILDTRYDRFIVLVEHYVGAAVDDRAGRDAEGRYAFLCRKEVGTWSFTRVSSLKRAEVAAIDAMADGWTPECVFDLDTLTVPLPPLEVGDEVLDETGEWREIIGVEARDDTDSLVLIWDGGYMFDDEIDEDGGVRRKTTATRWPVRHDIAATRTIVVFNTVATPNPNQEV